MKITKVRSLFLNCLQQLNFSFFISGLFSQFSASKEFFLLSDERNLLKCWTRNKTRIGWMMRQVIKMKITKVRSLFLNYSQHFSFQTYFLCLVLLKNSFFSLMKEIFWSVKQEIKIELDWSKMDHAVSNKDEDYEGEVIVS